MEPYEKLEAEWGRFAGVENVVACNSGTAALHLALESLGLPPGAGVIVPDFTMVACARAVAMAGLTPVLVDCGPDLLTDPAALVRAVEYGAARGLKAVMAVHVYGRPAQMGLVTDLAAKYGLAVVEDLAEAHGYPPHPLTDAACWSFYKNKVVGGEEGGAVAFRSPPHAATARGLRSLGFGPAQDYSHRPRGHNYRLANCLAEKVLGSLAGYGVNLALRRGRELAYGLRCPDEWAMPPRAVPWVYDFRVRGMTASQQDEAVRRMRGEGFAARHAFKPMSSQEEFFCCLTFGWGEAPVAGREVIYLALGEAVPDGAEYGRPFRIVREVLGSTP